MRKSWKALYGRLAWTRAFLLGDTDDDGVVVVL